ncbi:olfactory receptor 1019-like [Microcaecilia unicolor]|uniref:Olfactory receptor 1019-like n=1 Tax=Microcaecilia unicolor TaxID=1415580 RepID=A0A6P7ZSJ6_9AMPH|nr:olfactory receptor 1019-like [Microcaecilia unicolor]
MDIRNHSSVTEFILLGLTDDPELQILLFIIFSFVYIITILGNIGMLVVITTDPQLQTAMYFFLRHLSFVDLCYSTVIVPQTLINFLSERKAISFLGCAAQMFFFVGMGASEGLILALMSYDRYIAICNPLLYTTVMTNNICILLVSGAYFGGFLNSLIQTASIFSLSFCRSNKITHFFCDIPPLLKLSCSDTSLNEILLKDNHSSVTEFILLGLTDDPDLQILLFIIFSFVYIITILGNIGMLVVITTDSQLQTAMYFFLRHLSFVDLCYSTVIVPQTLINFLSEKKVISFLGCAAQMFFFVGLGASEGLILALMSYDRYIAICNPLLYTTVMTNNICILLVSGAYFGGFLNSLIQTASIFSLSFCRSNKITHFLCDIPPLLKLSCSDTSLNEILLFSFAGSIQVGTLLVILISYAFILCSILRMPSATGRHKAFNTCASHFLCVTLFYSTAIFMYMRPSSKYTMDQDRVVSVFYTVIIPMLNPLIYSLRNKDVKAALRKTIRRTVDFLH